MSSIQVCQSNHDENNSCILCKLRFNNARILHNHFKYLCEFTRRLLTVETRKQLDERKMHLLVNAMNKINLMFADDSQKVRYCVDVLADAIVIKKTCTTEAEADQVIEMCRNELLSSDNCTEILKNVEGSSQAVLAAPSVQRCSPQMQIVQYNQQLQTPIVQKPVMQQNSSQMSVDKNVGEVQNNSEKSKFNVGVKKSVFNAGIAPREMDADEQTIGVKMMDFNIERERSRYAFDPKYELIEGDGFFFRYKNDRSK